MKNIAFFCIPAFGHTNPLLPIARELVERGHHVRFYSFDLFKEKIESTKATYISCDRFLSSLTNKQEKKLKNISTTEMTIQSIHITIEMDSFLNEEFKKEKPDLIITDSACFWGKLSAMKYNIPYVVSTTTFAFNQLSSSYMKQSFKEVADIIFGLPKVSKELKKLEQYGYHVKNAISLVSSDNHTDTLVYTSKSFQPFAESFSSHYQFVGPSLFDHYTLDKHHERALIYISMGTIINERLDFYQKCIDRLQDEDVDIIISVGNNVPIEQLHFNKEKVHIYPSVNQLEVLSRANLFITHCGMNSVSESLYMATPMLLYPQTAEQRAVARRTKEIGAGIMLDDDIHSSTMKILNNPQFASSAMQYRQDFISSGGVKKAVDYIEGAPYKIDEVDLIEELNKYNRKTKLIYWMIIILLIFLLKGKYGLIIGIIAFLASFPVRKKLQMRKYDKMIKNY